MLYLKELSSLLKYLLFFIALKTIYSMIIFFDNKKLEEIKAKNTDEIKYKVYIITLNSDNRIQIIRTIRKFCYLSLSACSEKLENLPALLSNDISLENAQKLRYELKRLGAEVEILPINKK